MCCKKRPIPRLKAAITQKDLRMNNKVLQYLDQETLLETASPFQSGNDIRFLSACSAMRGHPSLPEPEMKLAVLSAI
jgi:hypothetical protein